MKTKIYISGAAGFIGFHICLKLVNQGHEVYGIDNINDYYDPKLKFDRLKELGFDEAESKLFKNQVQSAKFNSLRFSRIDLVDHESIDELFKKEHFEVVCNLAAQAGVRYSIDNPLAYVNTNILGFANILEGCRHNQVEHLVYASSSSIYGSNTKVPFSVHDNVDHPVSLYAASKKSNELMAHCYSHLYNLPTTGLRFFTVYGPWDRPDMALQKFTKSIIAGKKISVFNYGNHRRDFTYIEDVIEGIIRVIDQPATPNKLWDSNKPDPGSSSAPWRIYNIGNNSPVELLDYIKAIEEALNIEANINLMPLQPGDVIDTYADVKDLVKEFKYKPSMSIQMGVLKFIEWYKDYYSD